MEKASGNVVLMFFLRPFIFSLDPEKAHDLANLFFLNYYFFQRNLFSVANEEIQKQLYLEKKLKTQ